MTQLPFTYHLRRSFTPGARIGHTERILMRVLFWIVVVDIILALTLFLKLFVFAPTFSLPTMFASIPVASAAVSGPATGNFVESLNQYNLRPVIIGEISRRPRITVPGQLVALGGDNIQVFEYPDHDSAMNEATALAQAYTESSRSPAWKHNIHVFVKDSLLIFYMGNQSSIVAALEQHAGLSMTQTLPAIIYVSEVRY